MKLLLKKKKNGRETGDCEGQDGTQNSSADEIFDTEVEDGMSTSTSSDRIRFCCDISRTHHRKLKVYAAQQCMNLNDAVEELADRHCTA